MSSGKISRATIMDGQAPVAAVISPSAHAIHRAATRPGRMSLDKCVDGIQYIGCGESGTARRTWDEERGVSHDSTSQSATAAGDGAARCSDRGLGAGRAAGGDRNSRSAEHTSRLQSLMRISYAVFCMKK